MVASAALCAPLSAEAQGIVAPWGAQEQPSSSIRTLWIRPGDGADPVAITGEAQASVDGESLGAGCRGMFPSAPQQQLWVGGALPMLDVLVRSSGTITMAVRTPSGAVFCTEGAPGREARFSMRNVQAGTYLLWVGTRAGSVAYNLAASQRGPIVAETIAMPLSVAPVAPWQSTTTQSASGVTTTGGGGSEETGGTVPSGWVAVAPGSAGARDAQRSSGAQSAQRMGARGPIAAASQSASSPGAIDVAVGGVATHRRQGVVTGRTSLRFLARTCLGFGERTPTVMFTVQPGVPWLRVFVRANADSTVAVRAPNGAVFCADDTFGVHPGVDVEQPAAGRWQVFVGTYAPRVRMPYEWTVTTQRALRPDGASSEGGPSSSEAPVRMGGL